MGDASNLEDNSLAQAVGDSVDSLKAHHQWLMFLLEAWQVRYACSISLYTLYCTIHLNWIFSRDLNLVWFEIACLISSIGHRHIVTIQLGKRHSLRICQRRSCKINPSLPEMAHPCHLPAGPCYFWFWCQSSGTRILPLGSALCAKQSPLDSSSSRSRKHFPPPTPGHTDCSLHPGKLIRLHLQVYMEL